MRNAGFAFEVLPANTDETRLPGEPAVDYVLRLALAKARIAANRAAADAAAKERSQAICIGADTTVVLGSHILGKPANPENARWMLRELSGRAHEVLTGLALVSVPGRRECSQAESTKVTFAALSHAEIESYLASGEAFDKAGAYGIQGLAGRYVTCIEGCYFNVMGLPLSRLWFMLRGFGWRETTEENSAAG